MIVEFEIGDQQPLAAPFGRLNHRVDRPIADRGPHRCLVHCIAGNVAGGWSQPIDAITQCGRERRGAVAQSGFGFRRGDKGDDRLHLGGCVLRDGALRLLKGWPEMNRVISVMCDLVVV